MDLISEIQFDAEADGALAELLDAALREEGEPAPAPQIQEWIQKGHVRVDDVVVRDPRHPLVLGACVELSAWPAPASQMVEELVVDRAAIQHLDGHLLVAEYMPPKRVGPGTATVIEYLRRLLIEAEVTGLDPVPVPEHEPRTSGLVAAGLAHKGSTSLADGMRPLGVRGTAKALVRPRSGADLTDLIVTKDLGDTLLVRIPPTESTVEVRADLEARGLEILEAEGTEPDGTRPLLIHVVGLALTHPHTGHTQMWACMTPPWFKKALQALTP